MLNCAVQSVGIQRNVTPIYVSATSFALKKNSFLTRPFSQKSSGEITCILSQFLRQPLGFCF